MHLVFEALEVTYNEALGGDIIQVSFQEYPDPDLDYSKVMPPPIKGIVFSANYEFPPCDTLVEWCDGEGYDGGQKIKEINLTKTSLNLVTRNGNVFDVKFQTDDVTFENIQNFVLSSKQRIA
ncbi:hypothetical protein [Marinicellulosiphila megalodicopiae]|uniref:hypothetical protein n=1 Tax=Marinicellulosiphila megalodicopiae TaxID=2724896 RepID=UPI003BB0BDDE